MKASDLDRARRLRDALDALDNFRIQLGKGSASSRRYVSIDVMLDDDNVAIETAREQLPSVLAAIRPTLAGLGVELPE